MKLWIALSSMLIAYFIYGFYISQNDIYVIAPELKKENYSGLYDYRGVINVHSQLSIGSSAPAQIINAARLANLDFIILTDLNNFTPTGILNDAYYGSTLAITGGKYSYLDSRLMYLSAKKESLGSSLGEAQVKIADILSQFNNSTKDSLLFLAHPFEPGYSWVGEIPAALDGFEILNIKSLSGRAWEKSKASTMWSLLTYPFNPSLAFIRLFSEPSDELELFDNLAQKRKIVGIAGAEASARAIPLAGHLIKFPSYQRSFELFSNHLILTSELTGNVQSDRLKVFNAIKNGQFYMSFDLIGDPKGFAAYVEEKGRIRLMGSQIKLSKNLNLRVHLPSQPKAFYEVVIYRNGIAYRIFNETEVDLAVTEPGAYRVQVRVSPYLPLPDAKKWITWIYTNHFFINP